MSLASNLDKALKAIERNEQYIKQLEASGFKLPESYKRIPEELKAIKNDPNRSGINPDTLKKVQYLYNKNVINSRAKFDTTMTINSIGKTDIISSKKPIKPNQPKKLQEYSEKLNEILSDFLDKVDPTKNKNSELTAKFEKLERQAALDNIDLRNIDFTKLADIGPESLKYARLLRDIEQTFNAAPTTISPFKEDIQRKFGEEMHVKVLTSSDVGFSMADVSLLERYIDSSQFWKMIHKANYASSQDDNGPHEIKAALKRLKEAMDTFDKKDYEYLRQLLNNGNNYRAIDNFVKVRLKKLNQKSKA